MKKLGKFIFMLAFIALFKNEAKSQISISYYLSSLDKIGFSYVYSGELWGEVRLYGNTALSDITPEVVLCYNFIDENKYSVYAGGGFNINFYTGFVFPVGLQFVPLKDYDDFSLQFELQPMYDFDRDFLLQASLGIRYKL